jgi:tyrosine-specific transport protein
MVKNKSMGAILMILGTSIGAGMIALPVAAAQQTFLMSVLLLCASWFVMTLGALALLEVNLWMGPKKNFISMAGATLGSFGQVVSWFVYLLLLYGLLCAYIAGTSDVVHVVLNVVHINFYHWAEVCIALLLLAYIVFKGIKTIDFTNRILMLTKLIIFILVVLFLGKNVSLSHWTVGSTTIHLNTFMVMITSFGYSVILPSLVDYIDRDHKRAHRMILFGSLIPLAIYIIWIAVIQGIIPRDQLVSIAQGGRTVAELLQAMQHSGGARWVVTLANVFMSICAFTSFLGVSLSLVDFLADGMKVNKDSSKGWLVYLLTFLPPVIIVLLAPDIFIKALAYAGICCILLQIVLPSLMVLFGRHVKKYQHEFRLPGGALLLIAILAAGLALVAALIF